MYEKARFLIDVISGALNLLNKDFEELRDVIENVESNKTDLEQMLGHWHNNELKTKLIIYKNDENYYACIIRKKRFFNRNTVVTIPVFLEKSYPVIVKNKIFKCDCTLHLTLSSSNILVDRMDRNDNMYFFCKSQY